MSFWQRTIAGFYFLDEEDSQRPTLFAKGVKEALRHRCQIPHRTDPGNEYVEPKNTKLMETLVIIHVFQKNSRGLWESWTLVKMPRTDSNQYYSIAIGEAIQYSQECSTEPGQNWVRRESFATSKDQTPGPRSFLEIRERK